MRYTGFMSPPPLPPRRQRGAALLLLLLLLGTAAGGLLINAFGHSNSQAERELATVRQLELAKSALLGYAQTHGHLPSPAPSALEGKAAPQPCIDNASCSGYLPWATLGITGLDAWGKWLRYSVTPALTQAPLLRLQTVADRRILSRNARGDLVYRAGQASCSVAAPCMAAVLLSYGKNNFGTSALGLALSNGARNNSDEISNSSATRDFISRSATQSPEAPGGEFDDLVAWLPLPELYLHMNRTGQLP